MSAPLVIIPHLLFGAKESLYYSGLTTTSYVKYLVTELSYGKTF